MPTRELSSAPGTLPLFARAAAALVPGASRLPFVAGGGGEMPDLELAMNDVVVEVDRLAAYNRVCGFSLRDQLPVTYPHILAFPLHLALMTDGQFPFGAVGLVHIRNKITQHRPVLSSEVMSVRVRAGAISDHPAGQQFPLLTEVRVGDELVWEEESVNLRVGGDARPPKSRGGRRQARAAERELPLVAQWWLPGDLGRRYAAVSGDSTPIHMPPLSAKLFGFPSAIAHGMWTKARSLAAMEGRLPAAFKVSVTFKKPLVLPATVAFCEAVAEDGKVSFEVRGVRTGKSHLSGVVAG
ncbi:MAG: MaoC/PaaZ C-terminal domain-containing protein, partial [Solirubrobacteraceae bacterium]